MNERHTITLNAKAFDTLKSFGRFGESINELILRLMRTVEDFQKVNMNQIE